MQAKLSLAINAILIIAVAYLFATRNTSTDLVNTDGEEAQIIEVNADSGNVELPAGAIRIAYIQGDSINEKYKFIKDKQDELIRKSRRSDDKVRREMEAAQKRYMELMQKEQAGGFKTEQEVIQAQSELEQLQFKIEELQQSESEMLMRNEQEMQDEFFNRVTGYLKKFSAENDIDVVLNLQKGGSLLYSDGAFDITSEVLSGLNAEYAAQGGSKSLEE